MKTNESVRAATLRIFQGVCCSWGVCIHTYGHGKDIHASTTWERLNTADHAGKRFVCERSVLAHLLALRSLYHHLLSVVLYT